MTLVRLLKQIDIIDRNPVDLKNAGSSDFYVNVKKAYGYPKTVNEISEELWRIMRRDVTCIAASGYGGLSPATAISLKHNLNLALVRDEAKGYGRNGLIDGYVPDEQDRIAIVDDVFTTGGTLKDIMRILEPTRAEIVGCYVVVKRGEGELSVPLNYLLDFEELLQNGHH
ncbi:hypothetical protein CL616_01705 [archaeon]|nr:hypothetical protein [archaeon]